MIIGIFFNTKLKQGAFYENFKPIKHSKNGFLEALKPCLIMLLRLYLIDLVLFMYFTHKF